MITKEQLQNEIENITKQIIEKYKPEKIILFGSAASENFTEDSDLDFFVIKKDIPKFLHDRLYQLRKLIEENLLVDFLVYTPEEFSKRLNLGDPFIKSIAKEGKVLYG